MLTLEQLQAAKKEYETRLANCVNNIRQMERTADACRGAIEAVDALIAEFSKPQPANQEPACEQPS